MRLRKLWDWPRCNCVTFRKLGQMGRLGNQLFQIAATIGYAEQHGLRYAFRPWPYEPYFSLEGCFTTRLHTRHEYTQEKIAYDPIPVRRSLNLTGFFQSEKYFAHCKPLIRKLLAPREACPSLPGVAAIHVRRGDYLQQHDLGMWELLGMDYYEKAMEASGVDRFHIFSTDTEWCKEHFIGNQFTIIEGQPPAKDVALMASCEHQIIANSSFSWWGAWLNPNEEKRVIACNRWYGPNKTSYNLDDLLPAEWMRID